MNCLTQPVVEESGLADIIPSVSEERQVRLADSHNSN